MDKEQINNLTDAFFHNELSKAEESLLFTALSENDEAREYFKESLIFSESVKLTTEKVPKDIDKKILNKTVELSTKRKSIYQRSHIFIYLLAALFFLISVFFYQKLQEYHQEVNNIHKIVNYQNKVISLFINSLPAAQVNETLQNKIVIKKNL